MFYYDDFLLSCEHNYQWDDALKHLDELYRKDKRLQVLYSLIGFSWFYLTSGPLIEKSYSNNLNEFALSIWKYYINLGSIDAFDDPFFNFITGYTLSLHGIYINEWYERMGILYINRCLLLTKNEHLRLLAENFMHNQYSDCYLCVKDCDIVCKEFFNGNSLLDEYFKTIYNN